MCCIASGAKIRFASFSHDSPCIKRHQMTKLLSFASNGLLSRTLSNLPICHIPHKFQF